MSEGDVIEVWRWPLARGETLSSHDWFPFHYHRFLASSFMAECVMEERRADLGTALILWTEAMRQDPAGTLPVSELELATLAKFPSVAAWREAGHEPGRGALHGWVEVEVEDGPHEITRLGHVGMLMSVVEEMAKRSRGRKAKSEAGMRAQRKSRLKAQMRTMKVAAHMIDDERVIDALLDFFARTDLYLTADNVRAALRTEIGWGGQVVRMPGASETSTP